MNKLTIDELLEVTEGPIPPKLRPLLTKQKALEAAHAKERAHLDAEEKRLHAALEAVQEKISNITSKYADKSYASEIEALSAPLWDELVQPSLVQGGKMLMTVPWQDVERTMRDINDQISIQHGEHRHHASWAAVFDEVGRAIPCTYRGVASVKKAQKQKFIRACRIGYKIAGEFLPLSPYGRVEKSGLRKWVFATFHGPWDWSALIKEGKLVPENRKVEVEWDWEQEDTDAESELDDWV